MLRIVVCALLLLYGRLGLGSAAQPERIRISPQLAGQIQAVTEYFDRHQSQDPLCRTQAAQSRLAVLGRLRELVVPYLDQGWMPMALLKQAFRLDPLPGPVRLTRYAAFTVSGRRQADSDYDTPLLELPKDETGPSRAQAEERRDQLLYRRYSRQEILSGLLPAGLCRPLAWLRRSDFYDAQLQGSVLVEFLDGAALHFNVSRSNDRPYRADLPADRQERYWFFREVPQSLGYGLWHEWQLAIYPMAALAGDLQHFGLGAAVLLQGPRETWLAVLADSGGAFIANSSQLDLFLGVMKNRQEYQRLNRRLPETVSAFVLH